MQSNRDKQPTQALSVGVKWANYALLAGRAMASKQMAITATNSWTEWLRGQPSQFTNTFLGLFSTLEMGVFEGQPTHSQTKSNCFCWTVLC